MPHAASYCIDSDMHEDDFFESDSAQQIVRAKWMFDGAKTLDEIIDRLRDAIVHYEMLKQQGWQLLSPVDDDYGWIAQAVEHVVGN